MYTTLMFTISLSLIIGLVSIFKQIKERKNWKELLSMSSPIKYILIRFNKNVFNQDRWFLTFTNEFHITLWEKEFKTKKKLNKILKWWKSDDLFHPIPIIKEEK